MIIIHLFNNQIIYEFMSFFKTYSAINLWIIRHLPVSLSQENNTPIRLLKVQNTADVQFDSLPKHTQTSYSSCHFLPVGCKTETTFQSLQKTYHMVPMNLNDYHLAATNQSPHMHISQGPFLLLSTSSTWTCTWSRWTFIIFHNSKMLCFLFCTACIPNHHIIEHYPTKLKSATA